MLRWISCVVLSHVYFVLLYLLPKDGGGGSTYVSRKGMIVILMCLHISLSNVW